MQKALKDSARPSGKSHQRLMTPQFSAWVKRARSVDIGEIVMRRGLKLRGRGHAFAGACPVCGGHDRFAVHTGKQAFHCRACRGRGYGAVSLLMFIDGLTFLEAVEAITGEPLPDERANCPRKPDPDRDEQHERQRREVEPHEHQERRALLRANAVWHEAVPIANTGGAVYLAGRGIVLDGVPDHGGLRWHPRCPWEGGTQPCIVSRFTDAVTGELKGILRRPVNGEKPRTLGPMGGCVIRLWPDEEVTQGLVLGEGVETVLAAATTIVHRGTLLGPAWAAGSAGNLESFPVLRGIESLTILTDNDVSGRGQQAAHRCGRRWREAGRYVALLVPRRAGTDFNDIIRGTSLW